MARFFDDAREPVLIEPGDDPIALSRENLTLESRGRGLMLECWAADPSSAQGVLIRRVTGIRRERKGRLDLDTERFGGKPGTLQMVDVRHPAHQGAVRRGEQLKFREEFRLALRRQFAGWKLVELTSEADLEHTLSPAYSRALLKKGGMGIAAIGVDEQALDPDGALSFGLIWLAYLRQREPRLAIGRLAIFLPFGAESTTCHRVRHLDSNKIRCEVFAYGAGAREERVDPSDYTNLATRLDPFHHPLHNAPPQLAGWVARIAAIQGVLIAGRPDGAIALEVRGLEFARAERTSPGAASPWKLSFGIDHKHPATEHTLPEIEQLARELVRMRRADAADRHNPLFARHPEAWLESEIRRNPAVIDAGLDGSPIYAQAPAFGGRHRGILDLVSVDTAFEQQRGRAGQLVVVEVKASPDIHLPLQALDYWMRVTWHLERGEFAEAGYFPGIRLLHRPPRLLLVAPALEFHPSNTTVLDFFASNIEVTRIGTGIEWRRSLEVMFRR